MRQVLIDLLQVLSSVDTWGHQSHCLTGLINTTNHLRENLTSCLLPVGCSENIWWTRCNKIKSSEFMLLWDAFHWKHWKRGGKNTRFEGGTGLCVSSKRLFQGHANIYKFTTHGVIHHIACQISSIIRNIMKTTWRKDLTLTLTLRLYFFVPENKHCSSGYPRVDKFIVK